MGSILDSHNATLSKAYPWALSAPALAWNNIECSNCDKVALADELNAAGFLEEMFLENIDVATLSCETCDNPPSYNDPLHAGGPVGSGWENYQSQWQIESTGSVCAWDLTDNSLPPFRIAVVDQSIDLDHPDLIGKVETVWDHPDWEKNGQHGTVIVGPVIASINNNEGIAGSCDVCEVDLFAVRHDDPGSGYGEDVLKGTMEALRRGYKIVNVSFSSFGGSAAIAEAEARGAIISTGSGTNSTSQFSSYQASSNVLVSGSTRFSSPLGPGVQPDPELENLGFIDFLAPGNTMVRTEDPDVYVNGEGGVYYNPGGSVTSSVATMYLSGALGMLMHADTDDCFSPVQLAEFLKQTACTDLFGYDPNDHGAGHINVYAAIQAMQEASEIDGTPTYIDDAVTLVNEQRFYTGNVIIREGGSLTVQNSTLHFHEGFGIIVEDDGVFIATDSELQNNSCTSTFWTGIWVDGNAFKQGHVSSAPSASLSGTTVRNAKTGIQDYGQTLRAHNQGVISIESSTFENCRTAISSSDPIVAPLISSNEIRIDDDYPHAVREHVGIKLLYSNVGQVTQLSSNIFEDLRSDKEVGGTAIYVLDASFSVIDETKITGYLYGVKAFLGRIDNHLATVRDCESFNTTVSTWITGYNNPQVINNTFEAKSEDIYIDRFADPIPVQGIRMELCRRHTVEGNTITGEQLGFAKTHGVVIIGCLVSTSRDAVYNNTVIGCNYGMWSEGINSGSDNIEGLCYECNTFNGCERDIDSKAGATIALRQQGLEDGFTASAGNVFGSDLMQFASRGNDVDYFRVNPSEEPDPSFRVNPEFTPISNNCLPIFGFTGGEEPPCEGVEFEVLDTDRQTIEHYYAGGSTSEEEALIALSEFNRRYVMFTREYIDEVDECENGSLEEWEQVIQTSAPWMPLDETLIAIYEGDFSSAITRIEGLEPLTVQAEVDQLIGLIELAQDIEESSTDAEAEAAVTNANLTAYLTESETGQSYAQTLARATAEFFGLAAYEARLSDPTTTEQGGDSQPLVLSTPFELQDVTIYDALGRQIAKPNQGNYLTIDGLNESLKSQPNGIYYIQGTDDQGLIQTITVSNVK